MCVTIHHTKRSGIVKKKNLEGPLHQEFLAEEKRKSYQKRFYEASLKFSFFECYTPVTEKKIQKILVETFPLSQYPKNSLIRYLAVLDYLMDKKANEEFPLFDDKIAFLIQAIDPELSIYYHFLSVGYSNSSLEAESHKQALSIIHFIEDTVGIFDPNFLKYEEVYFQKVLKEGSILSGIKKEGSKKLLDSFHGITSFDEIKDIELQLLSKKAEQYFLTCKTPKDISTLCFNISNPNSVLELYDTTKKALFFILVIDPELTALRIYEEESTVEQMKERMIQTIGFYDENFIKLEEMYRKRFFPEMRISEWSY